MALIAATSLLGCAGEPLPLPAETQWRVEVESLDAAILALTGLASDGSDVLAVGGHLVGGAPPTLLRRKGVSGWSEVREPADWDGAIWHAWANGSHDVWLVGADLQVARGAPGDFEMMSLPFVKTGTTSCLYGVWGSGKDDVWLVGGIKSSAGARALIFRWDGVEIQQMALSGAAAAAAGETMYKVWGHGPDDVFVVGSSGTVIRWDGTEWTAASVDADVRLAAIHGDAERAFVVGGTASGAVLQWNGTGWTDIAGPDMPRLSSAYVGPQGSLWVGGVLGYIARWDGTAWQRFDTRVFQELHGLYAGEWGVFVGGGQIVLEEGPRDGVIGRLGI